RALDGPTALGGLMCRHGIRKDDVDRLLRGDVLVDLYGVVRQGVRASVESYSIKRLEPLYRYTREIGLRDVGPVIAAYQAWLQAGGEGGGGGGGAPGRGGHETPNARA